MYSKLLRRKHLFTYLLYELILLVNRYNDNLLCDPLLEDFRFESTDVDSVASVRRPKHRINSGMFNQVSSLLVALIKCRPLLSLIFLINLRKRGHSVWISGALNMMRRPKRNTRNSRSSNSVSKRRSRRANTRESTPSSRQRWSGRA